MIGAWALGAVILCTAASPPSEAPGPTADASAGSAAMRRFLAGYISYDSSQRQAYQGTQRAPLDRETFYRTVGRADLADEARHARHAKLLLYSAAGATVVAGLLIGTLVLLGGPEGPITHCQGASACVDLSRGTLGRGTMVAGVVGGGLLFLLGQREELDPVSADEAQHLAASYNGLRRRQTGLAGPAETSGRPIEVPRSDLGELLKHAQPRVAVGSQRGVTSARLQLSF